MADTAVTAANVITSNKAILEYGVYGATITAGQPVYRDPDDGNKIKPAKANGGGNQPKAFGVSVNGGAAGQPATVCVIDPKFRPGYAVAAGDIAIVSANAGRFCPAADLASGSVASFLFIGNADSTANLNPVAGTDAKA